MRTRVQSYVAPVAVVKAARESGGINTRQVVENTRAFQAARGAYLSAAAQFFNQGTGKPAALENRLADLGRLAAATGEARNLQWVEAQRKRLAAHGEKVEAKVELFQEARLEGVQDDLDALLAGAAALAGALCDTRCAAIMKLS